MQIKKIGCTCGRNNLTLKKDGELIECSRCGRTGIITIFGTQFFANWMNNPKEDGIKYKD